MPESPDNPVSDLLAALRHSDPGVRLDAATALRRIGDYLDQTLPVFVNDISWVDKSREADWQRELSLVGRPAVRALAEKATDDALPIERRILALRTIACEFYLDHDAAADSMELLIDRGSEIGAWAAVILALGGKQVHTHKSYLAALRSKDDRLVERAMHAMWSFQNRTAETEQLLKNALLPCLVHPNERVRGSFNMFDPPLTEDDLQNLNLKEDSPIDGVIRALGQMKSPPKSSLHLLIRGLFSEDHNTRDGAHFALIELGAFASRTVSEVAMDRGNTEVVRCAALRVLSGMKSLPPTIVTVLQSILTEEGRPGIHAAIVLAKHGNTSARIIEQLVRGVITDEEGAAGCVSAMPADDVVPALIAGLKKADTRGKTNSVYFLSDIGYDSLAAVHAVVDEFAHAANYDLRNRLGNALRNFEELAVPVALNALATYSRDEQIIWLMEGFEFLGPDAIAAVPALLPLLEHSNPDVRFHVAVAISCIDSLNPAPTPFLVDGLYSQSARQRNTALHRLAAIGADAAPCVPRLIELLDEPGFRAGAANVLGSIGPMASAAIPKLLNLLNSSNAWGATVVALGRIDPNTVPHLVAAMDREEMRKYVIDAFFWLKPLAAPAVTKLRTMLHGSDKLMILKGLANLGEVAKPATSDLLPLLDDPDQAVRWETIRTLGSLKAGGDSLLALAQSDERAIRLEALRNLGGPQPITAIPLLMAVAESTDPELAAAAFAGLAPYGAKAPRGFVALLQRRFKEEALQWTAIYAIKEMGPAASQAVSTIIPLLSDYRGFSTTAFETIAAIGPGAAEALPELERLLTDFRFRFLCRRAIWKVSPQRARELELKQVDN